MNNENSKVIDGILTEFVSNRNRVKIKKCCASCKNHAPFDTDDPKRRCTIHDIIVDKKDCCGQWIISDYINEIKLK